MSFIRKILVVALFVGLMVLGWVFAADHSDMVAIRVPGLEIMNVAVWTALLAAFGLGSVLVSIVAFLRIAHYKLLGRRYRKTIRGLEAEVHQLRNLPLTEADSAVPAEPDPASADSGRGV